MDLVDEGLAVGGAGIYPKEVASKLEVKRAENPYAGKSVQELWEVLRKLHQQNMREAERRGQVIDVEIEKCEGSEG